MQTEFYMAPDFCNLYNVSLIKSSLITPNSWLSHALGGASLFNVSTLTIAGTLDLINTTMFCTFILLEIVFTICLNVDMVYTIIQPFKRNAVLNRLNLFLKVGTIVTIFLATLAAL